MFNLKIPKRHLLSFLSCPILTILLSLPAFADETIVIGDVEGIETKIASYIKKGIFIPPSKESGGRWTLKEGYRVIQTGDLWKRGPAGNLAVQIFVDLSENERKRLGGRPPEPGKPRQITQNIGNHDANPISYLLASPSQELGEDAYFNNWLALNKRTNSEQARIDYWAKNNGLQDKVNYFWIGEAVEQARKSNPKANAEQFLKDDPKNPKAKIPDFEALEKVVPSEEAYRRFGEFIDPKKGLAFRLLELGSEIDTWTSPDGKTYGLSFHSGNLNKGNFGVLVGNSQNPIDIARVLKLAEKDPEGARALAREMLNGWVKERNSEFQARLAEVKKDYLAFKASKDPMERARLAKKLEANRLDVLTDATWHASSGVKGDANSLMYSAQADKTGPDGKGITGLPEEDIRKFLQIAEVDVVSSGHEPSGNIAVPKRQNRGEGNARRAAFYLNTDTSFALKEQTDHLLIGDDGSFHMSGFTKEGNPVILDYPGNEKIAELRAKVSAFSKATAEFSKEDIQKHPQFSEIESIKEQLEAWEKIGMAANGRIIIGFEPKKDKNGNWMKDSKGNFVPNYGQFITMQQNGYNFDYLSVDKWAIAKADLSEPISNPEEMKARAKQGLMKVLGEGSLDSESPEDLAKIRKAFAGKILWITNGSGANALDKARLHGGKAYEEALEAYRIGFAAKLEELNLSGQLENYVFLSGGTTGVDGKGDSIEAIRNKEILAFEKRTGKKVNSFAGFASVTGGNELDPSVRANQRIGLKAFFWDDYFKEFMDLAMKMDPKSIVVESVGGGAIVTEQLRTTQNLMALHPGKISLRAVPGITAPGVNMSATDQFLASDEASKLRGMGLLDVAGSEQPVISSASLASLVDKVNPPRKSWMKDTPILGYQITSDKFEDIPEAIRKLLDKHEYTPEYLRANMGSVIALQMKKGKPDVYIIGKDVYQTEYIGVPKSQTSEKNPKYYQSLRDNLGDLVDDQKVISVLKVAPAPMVALSELIGESAINRKIVIESPWGRQVKEAGDDAYVIWDESEKKYYFVEEGDAKGWPAHYVPDPHELTIPENKKDLDEIKKNQNAIAEGIREQERIQRTTARNYEVIPAIQNGLVFDDSLSAAREIEKHFDDLKRQGVSENQLRNIRIFFTDHIVKQEVNGNGIPKHIIVMDTSKVPFEFWPDSLKRVKLQELRLRKEFAAELGNLGPKDLANNGNLDQKKLMELIEKLRLVERKANPHLAKLNGKKVDLGAMNNDLFTPFADLKDDQKVKLMHNLFSQMILASNDPSATATQLQKMLNSKSGPEALKKALGIRDFPVEYDLKFVSNHLHSLETEMVADAKDFIKRGIRSVVGPKGSLVGPVGVHGPMGSPKSFLHRAHASGHLPNLRGFAPAAAIAGGMGAGAAAVFGGSSPAAAEDRTVDDVR